MLDYQECIDFHAHALNFSHPDYDCCTYYILDKIKMKEWCDTLPLDHEDIYMQDGKCLECAEAFRSSVVAVP